MSEQVLKLFVIVVLKIFFAHLENCVNSAYVFGIFDYIFVVKKDYGTEQ